MYAASLLWLPAFTRKRQTRKRIGKMDRAAKVRMYRDQNKKRKGMDRGRGGQMLFLSAVCAVCVCVLGGAMLAERMLGREQELTYVTCGELASLMSFLGDAPAEDMQNDAGNAVTFNRMKEMIQVIGLGDVIPMRGGSGKMTRGNVMNSYDQILDYLDMDGSVEKKTLLFLKQKNDRWLTDAGYIKLHEDSGNPLAFCAYEVYLYDGTMLGIGKKCDDTVTLRGVTAESCVDGQLAFFYQEERLNIPCSARTEITEETECDIDIRGGKAVTVEPVSEADGDADVSKADGKGKKDELPDSVRVLLLNGGGIYYKNVYLICDSACVAATSSKTRECKAQELLNIKSFKLKEGRCLMVTPDKEDALLYLADKGGKKISNGYYGSMLVYRDKDGYYIVNKVDIEKYLYSVVASEMPSSFSLEALKAQAVCARSYVYRQMQENDYADYHAQIDDSTNYQVYNRVKAVGEDVEAVNSTEGIVMLSDGELVNAYYFSSSCGFGSGMDIWNQEGSCGYLGKKSLLRSGEDLDLSDEETFWDFIRSDEKEAYDSASRYYRWTARLEPGGCIRDLKKTIMNRKSLSPQNITLTSVSKGKTKKASSCKGFGGVKKLSVSGRNESGAILELTIQFEFGKVVVRSEYNIRAILGCAMEKITYADGSTDESARFLPSAYCAITFDKKSGRYVLYGGGNGHGMGMSQYGADGMAKDGWDYKKILRFFYDGADIVKI